MCPTRRIIESARRGLKACLPVSFWVVAFWVLFTCTGCQPAWRGVVLGDGFLDKQRFFEFPSNKALPASEIQTVSEIRLGKQGTRAIAVFSYKGGYCLEPDTGEVLQSLSFKGGEVNPVPVDVNDDGSLEVFTRGGGYYDVQLLDRTGRVIWKRPGSFSEPVTFLSGDVGDANGDGTPEFYLASTAGLYCLAPTGETHWVVAQENDYTSVAFDRGVPGRDPPRLVAVGSYRNRPGHFVEFRSTSGDLIAHDRNYARLVDLHILRWPTEGRPLRILDCSCSGRTAGLSILEERGPGGGRYWPATDAWLKPTYVDAATFIRFDEDGTVYLAVLFGYKAGIAHTLLTVYSLDGLPVYQEYLPRTTGLLATRVDRYSQEGEVLLVGDGRDRVAVYTLGRSTGKQR